MPEDFSDVLTDIATTASNAATPAGADAARARAKQRTAHQRFAAAGLAVVLVAATGGVAALAATNHSHGAAPIPPAHSKTATPHPSRSSTPSASASASASSTPTGTSGSSAPSGSPGNYQTVVPAAWTDTADIADDSTQYPWQATSLTPQILTGSDEQNEYQFAYACMSQTGFQDTVMDAQGMQTIQYTSTAPGEFPRADVYAMQSMYFYADAQTAATAYNQAQHDLTTTACGQGNASAANGQSSSWHATSVAQVGSGFAANVTIRNSNGQPVQLNGNYGDSADYGDELVLSGNVLEIVNVDESLTNPMTDLYHLESGMCAYTGACPTGTVPFASQVTPDSGTTVGPGGSPIQFTVSVTNDFASEVSGIGLVVSLGHCSCVQTPVEMAPAGTLQIWNPASSSWQSIFYDAEGTGTDFKNVQAVPDLDLAPGETVSYKFQLSLPASQTATVSSGTFNVDTLMGYGSSGSNLAVPMASLPITVNPS